MRKIRFFKQHSQETCGISCMLMALDYFDVDYPTVGKEARLYRIYGAKSTPGTLGASIALALSRRGLRVSLVHSSENMLDNRGDYHSAERYAEILEEYKACIARAEGAFSVSTGAQIDCAALRRELAQGLVILQCFVEGDADGVHDRVPHGILLYDFEDGRFFACDPLRGKVTLTEAEIEESMEAPLGRMYIAVGRREEKGIKGEA